MTKDAIHFAFKGEDVEIDRIPLAEITMINVMIDSDIGTELNNCTVLSAHGEHRIQISTELGGYNSGRAYYILTNSKLKLDEILRDMRKGVLDATKRRDNHTPFQRIQLKVRRIYESAPSQALIILLIALVTRATSTHTAVIEAV